MRAFLWSILPSVSNTRLRASQPKMLKTSRFPHKDVLCKEPCARARACGHPCLEACYSTCRCICSNDRDVERAVPVAEELPIEKTQSKTDSSSHSRVRELHQTRPLASSPISQRSRQEIERSIKAYQDFSKGGHVEADKEGIANAKEQAAVATDAEALEKLRILDEEMEAALFGDLPTPSPPKASPKKEEEGKLVRPGADGKSIFRWQDTFIPGGSSGEKAKEPEPSLLD